jgi:hypothetical protein
MVGAFRELFTRRDIGYKDKGTIYKCCAWVSYCMVKNAGVWQKHW